MERLRATPRRGARPARRDGGRRHDDDDGRAPSAGTAPSRAPAPGLQVVRRANERRVRARDQRRRRSERVGQEQSRRCPALGARRAGPGTPLAQVRGRHLGGLREAGRPGDGRRDARHRQRRRPAAGRLPGPRARPAALPLRRERLPPQQEPDPAARARRSARRGASRRQRLPVHRPGHGRPGARAASRGATAAVRRGGGGPPPRATAPPRRGAARRVRGEPRAGRGHPRRAATAGPAAGRPGRAAGDSRVDGRRARQPRCWWRCTPAGSRRRRG